MGYPQSGYMGDVPSGLTRAQQMAAQRAYPRAYLTRAPDELGSWLSSAVKAVSKAVKQVETNVAHAPSILAPVVKYAVPIAGAALAPFTGGTSLLVAGAVSKASSLLDTAKTVRNVVSSTKVSSGQTLAPSGLPVVYTAPIQSPTIDPAAPVAPSSGTSDLLKNPAVLIGGGALALLALSSLSGNRR